jgi:hypothetical protein
MENEINKLSSEISQLSSKIDLLIQEVRTLNKSCNRMDEHITFVNKVYNTVRSPVSYIISNVNKLTGGDKQVSSLPSIQE